MKNRLINAAIALISAFVGVALYTSLFETPCQETRLPIEKAFDVPYVRIGHNNAMAQDPLSEIFTQAVDRTTATVVHVEALDYYSNSELIGSSNKMELKDKVDGSGVVFSSDGYIVTNAHVVQNADKIVVTLTNKNRYVAHLIGLDFTTDIALLKIKSTNLPFVRPGDSDAIKVGQWVLAVGNPFKLSSTVTAGIVSSKARALDFTNTDNVLETYIQTDAAVNQGSSGGALINTKGELIGINSAIATTSGQFQGYSFAIPSNVVYKIVRDLKVNGSVNRVHLGIFMRDLDIEKDSQINGVFVTGINENGPASNTGLRGGDVIIRLNGYLVSNVAELQNRMIQLKVGGVANLVFLRDGKKLQTQIVSSPDYKTVDATVNEVEAKLGAIFEIPSKEDLKSMFLDYGIQVLDITDGILEGTAIEKGFIIYEVNNKPVKDLNEFFNIINTLQGKKSIKFVGRYPNKKRDRAYVFNF